MLKQIGEIGNYVSRLSSHTASLLL